MLSLEALPRCTERTRRGLCFLHGPPTPPPPPPPPPRGPASTLPGFLRAATPFAPEWRITASVQRCIWPPVGRLPYTTRYDTCRVGAGGWQGFTGGGREPPHACKPGGATQQVQPLLRHVWRQPLWHAHLATPRNASACKHLQAPTSPARPPPAPPAHAACLKRANECCRQRTSKKLERSASCSMG